MANPTDPGVPAHRVTGVATDGASHTVHPRAGTLRLISAIAGVLAVIAAIGLGAAALIRSPGDAASTLTSARHITVDAPAMPLSVKQITDLLSQPPDYGGLGDPVRRASCLAGLGYPAATRILGARSVEVDGQPGVVLVVAGESATTMNAIAVATTCSAADTGLLADTTLARP
jgi:hypothetical protein